MRAIDDLKSLGYEIALRGDKVAYKYQGSTEPDPSLAIPLLQELKTRKQEAITYLSAQDATRTAQTKYCSWREMAVPAEECKKPLPCYRRGEWECKHLIAWWSKRLEWLDENNIGVNRHG